MSPSKFCTRDESAKHEATSDPIFLVLAETAQLLDFDESQRPEGWWRDEGDCNVLLIGEGDDAREPTFDELEQLINDEMPVRIDTRVESVWLTRQEAEAWVESHRYRWRSDTRVRVYCVCAEGELAALLRDGSEPLRSKEVRL